MLSRALLAVFLALTAACAWAQDPPPNLIRNGDCEQWQWREFTEGQRTEIKALLAKGVKLADLNLEIRGPLYRGLVGYDEIQGTMVEGPEAGHGRSLRLCSGDDEAQWGYHYMLTQPLKPGGTYAYDVFLQGQGTLSLRALLGGKDLTTGVFAWLGYPELLKLTATETWQRFQGTLTVPDLGTPERPQDGAYAALTLAPHSTLLLDDLSLRPAPEAAPPP